MGVDAGRALADPAPGPEEEAGIAPILTKPELGTERRAADPAAISMYTLVYSDDAVVRRQVLAPGDTIVGRAPVCDLPIDDSSISRRHARFRVHGDRCRLTDLGGRNGTFVNGEPVTEAELHDGDSVVLGRFALRIEKSEAPGVVLSEHHSLLETAGTVYRKVDAQPGTVGVPAPAADPRRLLALLTEISRQLVQPRPLSEILERVVTVALESVPAERAFLFLVDAQGGEVVPQVARTREGSAVGQTSISRTIIRRTLDERLAMLAVDAQLDPSLAEVNSVRAANIRSFMAAPLWHEGEAAGVLYVDSPRTAPLTAADLDILQALSAYAGVAIAQTRLSQRLEQESRFRERLQRYHSAAVIEQILTTQGGSDSPFLAEERDLTVLFADIVGFTQLAERMSPGDVARLLNRCFAVMCEAVFAEHGTLDKFIGDAVLAVFGAPLEQPDHRMRAVRSALAMRRAVAGLGLQPPIRLRIAMNSGRATVGDIGSSRRREYTVLGDVVNACSRLVSEACAPDQIVLAAATAEGLDLSIPLRGLGHIALRGRTQPVGLFEVSGPVAPEPGAGREPAETGGPPAGRPQNE